jgi:hypothetical protein
VGWKEAGEIFRSVHYNIS